RGRAAPSPILPTDIAAGSPLPLAGEGPAEGWWRGGAPPTAPAAQPLPRNPAAPPASRLPSPCVPPQHRAMGRGQEEAGDMAHKVSPLAPRSYPELPEIAGVRFATTEAGIKYK